MTLEQEDINPFKKLFRAYIEEKEKITALELIIEHKEEELKQYQKLVRDFLFISNKPLDKIVPEDLELGLEVYSNKKPSLNNNELENIIELCKKLGFEYDDTSYKEIIQLKIFIKELARKNSRIKK